VWLIWFFGKKNGDFTQSRAAKQARALDLSLIEVGIAGSVPGALGRSANWAGLSKKTE